MTIELTAFRWVPPFAQGHVRDLRVRWALEEAGLPYEVVLIDGDDQRSPAYHAQQPFGQVPVYRDGEVEMFESGAIVLHIAEKSEVLAPKGVRGRARVLTWVVAALNSIEPFVNNLVAIDLFHADEPWAKAYRPRAETALRGRLEALAMWLDGRDYLEDRFTAGDLIMTTVLRELGERALLSEFPALDEYRRHCQARPPFSRALEAQLKPFREHAPA